MVIPFVIWSSVYSGISLAKDIYHGITIHWFGYAYRFVVGKSSAPFYYIVVLIQLTIITPWLVKLVKQGRKVKNLLWLITPCYLVYIYVRNYATGSLPRLYETLLPAWFGFYYLGIHVRCGLQLKCSGRKVLIALLISCAEAFILRKFDMSRGFYTSQITIGSFLFSVAMIGWFLKQSDKNKKSMKIFREIGNCSYGIFYVHMAILILVEKLVQSRNWYLCWSLRFLLTAALSFAVVLIAQRILKNERKVLRHIGFI